MRRKRTLISITAAATLAGAATPAVAAHTINVAGGRVGGHVSSIGDFRPASDPSIAAARRVFGRPSSRTRTSANSCDVRWSRLRLRITFATFGGVAPGQTICSDRGGSKAQTFRVRGPRIRTWKGLRVGNREERVLELHPTARFRRGSWWLKTSRSLIGEPTDFPVVDATVDAADRIKAIRGFIGAAGD
jgi:hypothetical protein